MQLVANNSPILERLEVRASGHFNRGIFAVFLRSLVNLSKLGVLTKASYGQVVPQEVVTWVTTRRSIGELCIKEIDFKVS